MRRHYGDTVSSGDGELDRYEAKLTGLLDGLDLELGQALERVEELTGHLYSAGVSDELIGANERTHIALTNAAALLQDLRTHTGC